MHKLVRKIAAPVQAELWGRAAGRCEFNGCNLSLWKSPTTQEPVNIAEKAHIYAFSPDGPRGHKDIPKSKLNSADNLMLVCHACHKTIDKDKGGSRYSAELLAQWKAEHELRVERVTGVNPTKKSHVLFYGAKIGETDAPTDFNSAALAMFPDRYPVDDKPIVLPATRTCHGDKDAKYWGTEDAQLIQMFDRRVRQPIQDGHIGHLSVFALAPQPLLIRLGSLLTDITEVQVYGRSREPQGWKWRRHPRGFRYVVRQPASISGPPALVLALSADITEDRVKAVLGDDVTVWKITIPRPHNDFLRSKRQLQEFRELARGLMVQIKKMHGNQSELHIFPAAPVAIAVELGRIRMPKANMKWHVYDQVNARGGFVSALTLS